MYKPVLRAAGCFLQSVSALWPPRPQQTWRLSLPAPSLPHLLLQNDTPDTELSPPFVSTPDPLSCVPLSGRRVDGGVLCQPQLGAPEKWQRHVCGGGHAMPEWLMRSKQGDEIWTSRAQDTWGLVPVLHVPWHGFGPQSPFLSNGPRDCSAPALCSIGYVLWFPVS